MVAISLYRGNLHKVPEASRRWVMPKHRLSLRQFRALLARRERALHALISFSSATSEHPPPLNSPALAVADELACPNQEDTLHSTCSEKKPQNGTAERGGNGVVVKSEKEEAAADAEIGVKDAVREEGGAVVPEGGGATLMDHGQEEQDVNYGGKDGLDMVGYKTQMVVQESRAPDVFADRGTQKIDLKQKLENLNKEKHHLVQMLKQASFSLAPTMPPLSSKGWGNLHSPDDLDYNACQILNAEEEIKRRHSMRASQINVHILAQLEASTIAGTLMRQAVQRPGSDIYSTGDLEGELEDASNPHIHSMYQASTTSPSAGSPLARPAYDFTQSNVMAHANRVGHTTAAHSQAANWLSSVSASPSRFASSAGQGHPANLPPLSMSGIQFTASTPSPAALTGTSTFRDNRPNQS